MVEGKGTGIEENFGLKPKDLELIRQVFHRHPEVRQVRIFGSRAMGCFQDYSDIDLALWGDLTPALIARIRGELEELPLPYIFDVQAYDAIKHPPLKRHIDEMGRTLHGTDFSPPAAAQNHSSP